MKLGSISNDVNFKGIAVMKSTDSKNRNEVILKEVDDSFTKNLSKKYDVIDTLSYSVKPNSKEENFVKEFCDKMGIPFKNIGTIFSFFNRYDTFQIVGDKGNLTVTGGEYNITEKLKKSLKDLSSFSQKA